MTRFDDAGSAKIRMEEQTMLQSLWSWAAIAFVVVLALSLIPGAGGFMLAPLAALLIGGVAAWYTRDTTGGTRAGAVAGLGALVASIIAFAGFGLLLGTNPAIQEFVRSSEPHPEARIPYAWMPSLGIATGALVGIGMGLFNLALSTIGGMATSVLVGHKPGQSLHKVSS